MVDHDRLSGRIPVDMPPSSDQHAYASAWALGLVTLGAVGAIVSQHLAQRLIHHACGSPARNGRDRLREKNKATTHTGNGSVPQNDILPKPGDLHVVHGVAGLIGDTKLVRINSLSDQTGAEIWGKAELLNPGGSPKDRVGLEMLLQAERAGEIESYTGCCVFEGTVGSTGISLAMLCRAKGYKCHIVLPDDVAQEKLDLLLALGAIVEKRRPAPIADPGHYVNVARRRAQEYASTPEAQEAQREHAQARRVRGWPPVPAGSVPRGLYAEQFENLANFSAHYATTGPEIWDATSGSLDAYVAGAGTGGTLCGAGAYMKNKAKQEEGRAGPIVVLADPQGSGLFNRVTKGVMFNLTEREGRRRRHQVDTVVEGVGINRLTVNWLQGEQSKAVDLATRVSDDAAARMGRHLVQADGLFVGSSSAVNCVASVRVARFLQHQGIRRPIVVTILSDSGVRHLSKFHSDQALKELGIPNAGSSDISDLLSPLSRDEIVQAWSSFDKV